MFLEAVVLAGRNDAFHNSFCVSGILSGSTRSNHAAVCALCLQALDGGYLALLAAEAVRGKKLPAGVEQGIMASGFLLITAVGLLLVLRDTLNLTLGSMG